WKRKSSEQFVSLKLNEPQPAKSGASAGETAATNGSEAAAGTSASKTETALPASSTAVTSAPALEPAATGPGPTPIPIEVSVPKVVERPSQSRLSEAEVARKE